MSVFNGGVFLKRSRKKMDKNTVKQLDSFIWWKKRKKKEHLECAFFMLFMNILLVGVLLLNIPPNVRIIDFVFGIVCLCIFVFLMSIEFCQWYKSFHVEPDDIFYGFVLEKTRYTRSRRHRGNDNRGYYIIANKDGIEMEGKCKFEMYKQLSIGEPVIIFSVGTKEKFAIPLTLE